MQMLSCQACGAPVHWDGASRIAACAHCGAEYLMHPQSRCGSQADGVGRDEVAVIPIRESAHAGRVYARSFIPRGWTAAAANPELTSSLLTPLTMRIRYTADDGRATVSRTGCVAYEHIDDAPGNAGLQWSLQMPDCKRVATYRDAPAMCDMAVAGESVATCQLVSHETDEDDVVRRLVEKMRANVAHGNVAEWNYSYCRRTYRVTQPDGTQRRRTLEALVDYVAIPPDPSEVQLFEQARSIMARTRLGGLGALGSLFGLGGVPGLEQPHMRYQWEIAFMIDVDAAPEAFDAAREACRLIRASYEESPAFERAKAQIRDHVVQAQMQQAQAVNAAMSQMARDNAAHWDRMNDIVRDTNDYTTDVMHDMFAANAASHDRVANLNSEMLREVNTFHANGGVVEASTSWDHVYQSDEHPDWFVATEGFELRPGIDFEELHRTDGDY